MQIQLNLGDIDFTEASTKDALMIAVSERIVQSLEATLIDDARAQLDKMMSTIVKTKVEEIMTALASEILDYRFTETSSWGEKKGTYTVRDRIIKAFKDQTEYKSASYSSDANSFTKFVKDVLDTEFNKAKPELMKRVNEDFTAKCFEYAKTETLKKLGVAK